jgi:hypothetical protein
MDDPASRLVLRDLLLAARLTLAVFLTLVGVGYFSALINLHCRSASAGELLSVAAGAGHLAKERVIDPSPGGEKAPANLSR